MALRTGHHRHLTFHLRAEGGAVTTITGTVDRQAQTAVLAPKT